MADVQAAKRYAQAAFELALSADNITLWRSELGDVAQVLSESEAAPIFNDDRIPLSQREAMVDRTLDISPMVLNLARLLAHSTRRMREAAPERHGAQPEPARRAGTPATTAASADQSHAPATSSPAPSSGKLAA